MRARYVGGFEVLRAAGFSAGQRFGNAFAALALVTLVVMAGGCGAPVTVAAASAAVAASCVASAGAGITAATGAVTSLSLCPPVVQAGAGPSTLTLRTAGLGTGATVQLDGAARAATLRTSNAATVALTAPDVAAGTRHNITVTNPGFAASDARTLLVTGGYWAFGDSITYGYGLAAPAIGNYATLLATKYGLSLVNSAVGGDQACDVWPQLYRSRAGYTAVAAPLFSLMIGTNDVDVKGPGPYQAVFRNCSLAALAWMGTPRTAKILPGDSAFVASGGCGGTAGGSLGTATCGPAAGEVSIALVTSGNSIYVWYLLSDSASTADSLTVQVDGAAAGTIPARPPLAIATANGGSQGVGVVRLPVPAGPHTVRITTSGTVGVLGAGSHPAMGADRPRLLVGDLPNQAQDHPVATVAAQLAYVADLLTMEAQLQADGMDLRRAQTRNYMQGTVFEMNDQLHPNVVGQQELEAAFDAALP